MSVYVVKVIRATDVSGSEKKKVYVRISAECLKKDIRTSAVEHSASPMWNEIFTVVFVVKSID